MHRPHVQPLRRSPPGFLRGASVAVLAQGFHKRPKLARHACQPKVVPASFKDDSSAFLQSWSFSRAEQAWVLALATLCLPWSWTTVRAQRRGGLVHGAPAVAGPLGANARRTWAHLRPAWDTAVQRSVRPGRQGGVSPGQGTAGHSPPQRWGLTPSKRSQQHRSTCPPWATPVRALEVTVHSKCSEPLVESPASRQPQRPQRATLTLAAWQSRVRVLPNVSASTHPPFPLM